MKDFLLIYRTDEPTMKALPRRSPEELEANMKRWMDWLSGIAAENKLVDRGNTVLVIEHNMDVIKVADHIIDLGPEGGDGGGKILFEGTPEGLINNKESYTAEFLSQELK